MDMKIFDIPVEEIEKMICANFSYYTYVQMHNVILICSDKYCATVVFPELEVAQYVIEVIRKIKAMCGEYVEVKTEGDKGAQEPKDN